MARFQVQVVEMHMKMRCVRANNSTASSHVTVPNPMVHHLAVSSRLFAELESLKLKIAGSVLFGMMRTEELQRLLELHQVWLVLRDKEVQAQLGFHMPFNRHLLDLTNKRVHAIDRADDWCFCSS